MGRFGNCIVAFGCLTLAACGGDEVALQQTDIDVVDQPVAAVVDDAVQAEISANIESVEAPMIGSVSLTQLDCGKIGVNNLDNFADDGSYAGQTDNFASPCFLIRHPGGTLLWDTGLPGQFVHSSPIDVGEYIMNLRQTLRVQLEDEGVLPEEIDFISVSHSHFDHIGQVDQIRDATWLVHADEYTEINRVNEDEGTDGSTSSIREAFLHLTPTQFRGEYDVFGDGKVIIFETPGHTPGHCALQILLEETGPVLLTGDLYHRKESRNADDPSLSKVPRFNFNAAQTRRSMAAFEERARRLDARVIIQHEPDDLAWGGRTLR